MRVSVGRLVICLTLAAGFLVTTVLPGGIVERPASAAPHDAVPGASISVRFAPESDPAASLQRLRNGGFELERLRFGGPRSSGEYRIRAGETITQSIAAGNATFQRYGYASAPVVGVAMNAADEPTARRQADQIRSQLGGAVERIDVVPTRSPAGGGEPASTPVPSQGRFPSP